MDNYVILAVHYFSLREPCGRAAHVILAHVLTLHVQRSLLRDLRCSSTGLRRTKEGDLSDEVCYHQLLGTHGHACMLRLLCCDETLCCYLLHAVHTPCTNNFLRWRPGLAVVIGRLFPSCRAANFLTYSSHHTTIYARNHYNS
jgi:hypothetical protein